METPKFRLIDLFLCVVLLCDRLFGMLFSPVAFPERETQKAVHVWGGQLRQFGSYLERPCKMDDLPDFVKEIKYLCESNRKASYWRTQEDDEKTEMSNFFNEMKIRSIFSFALLEHFFFFRFSGDHPWFTIELLGKKKNSIFHKKIPPRMFNCADFFDLFS